MAGAPATPPAAPVPTQLDPGRSYGYDRSGKLISVAKGQEAAFSDMGGREATGSELEDISEARAGKRLDQMVADKAARRQTMSAGELLGDVTAEALNKAGTQAGGFIGGGGMLGGVVGALGAGNRKVQAFGEGANEAATFGVSKLAAKGIAQLTGGDQASAEEVERRQLLEQTNGGAKMLGTVGGLITQTIATAGGGSGAGAAGAAAKAGKGSKLLGALNPVGLAGDAVEHGIASAAARLGTRATALGRIGTSAVSMGIRGAVEGALQEGAQEVTDDLFADRELSGEKVAAAMGHGALFGGATGGVLGGLGGAAGEIGGKLSRFANRGAAGDLARLDAGAARAAEAGGEKIAAGGKVERLMQSESAEAAYRAAGGTRVNARRVTRDLGENGVQDLGQFIHDRIIAPEVKASGTLRGIANTTPDKILEASRAGLEVSGQKIGRILEQSSQTVPLSALYSDADELMGKLNTTVEGVKVSRAVESTMKDFTIAMENAGLIKAANAAGGRVEAHIPLAELAKQRRSLASIAYEAGAGGSSATKTALQDWERKIEGRIMEGVDKAAETSGAATKADYLSAKRDYQMFKATEKVAETGVERMQGNNRIGLRSAIAGATGGPLALVGTHLVSRYGDAAAAVMLRRAAENASVIKAVQRIDNAVSRAARGVVEGGAKIPRKLPAAVDPRPRARGLAARVAAAQGDPMAYVDRVRSTSKGLQNAPETASSADAASARAMSFLASKLPPQGNPDPLRPERGDGLSKQDAAKFLKYADAVKDPTQAFDDIARGRVNREAIETLQAVYPKLYGQLQQQTLARVTSAAAKGKPMPYATRVRIGTVLGMPLDPSMKPEMMRALQANVMPVKSTEDGAGAPPSGAPPQSPRRPLSSNLKTQQAGLDAVE